MFALIRTCSDAIQNLQLNTGSQAQTVNLRHKFEILLNQVKDFDTILLNISDTSEKVITYNYNLFQTNFLIIAQFYVY